MANQWIESDCEARPEVLHEGGRVAVVFPIPGPGQEELVWAFAVFDGGLCVGGAAERFWSGSDAMRAAEEEIDAAAGEVRHA